MSFSAGGVPLSVMTPMMSAAEAACHAPTIPTVRIERTAFLTSQFVLE
jgi:hypothetical protein